MPGKSFLLPNDIRTALSTRWMGRRVYCLPEVDSTNRLAADLAVAGEREGTLVVADYQNAGRGQQRNRWLSPRGRGLLFSLILRPRMQSQQVLPVTLTFALTVAETLSKVTGEEMQVKWPNDVVSPSGKIGGILAEISSRSGQTSHLVLGIGLNINTRSHELPATVDYPAASCLGAAGTDHDRLAILVRLLACLEPVYERFVERGFGPFVSRYRDRMWHGDGEVEVDDSGRTLRGRIQGVHQDGGLILRTGRGKEQIVYGRRVRKA